VEHPPRWGLAMNHRDCRRPLIARVLLSRVHVVVETFRHLSVEVDSSRSSPADTTVCNEQRPKHHRCKSVTYSVNVQ